MVVWSDTSIMHITEFIDDAKNGTEQTAKIYMKKLVDYSEILDTMPKLGKDFQFELYDYELKQLIYKKHRIIYHIKDNNVVILAVIHTRLDIKKVIRSIKKGIN